MAAKTGFTVAEPIRVEIKIRRSTFIGSLEPVSTREAAQAFLQTCRATYHDATHNCFAYRIDQQDIRYSDDGEPSGTAGKPILQMLEKHQLIRSIIVVTRYFGGIKLGTGGLIRAYSRCAEEAIQKAQLEKFVQYHSLLIEYPYHFTRQLHHLADQHDSSIISSEYSTAIQSAIRIPEQQLQHFKDALIQAGDGQIEILDESSECT